MNRKFQQTSSEKDSSQVSSLDINVSKPQFAELQKQLCNTESEYHAQKLNTAEQYKLTDIKSRIEREKLSRQKQYSHNIKTFRAKSAKYLREPDEGLSKDDIFVQKTIVQPSVRKRPHSLPVVRKSPNKGVLKTTCSTCKKTQNLIIEYEKLSADKHDAGREPHTRYLFTEQQVKTFLTIFETKYCSSFPEMTVILHDYERSLEDLDKLEDRPKLDTNKEKQMQNRIHKFCKSQEIFNKQHPLPETVKTQLERIRIDQAVLLKRQSTKPNSIANEVRRKLGFHKT